MLSVRTPVRRRRFCPRCRAWVVDLPPCPCCVGLAVSSDSRMRAVWPTTGDSRLAVATAARTTNGWVGSPRRAVPRALVASAIGVQSASQGCAAARVVQTHQTPTRIEHRSRRRNAQAGDDYLAHAEQTEDVCRVPRTRSRMMDLARFGANPEWKRAASCRPIRSWPLGRCSGCFPSRALSSAQVKCIVTNDQDRPKRPSNEEGDVTNQNSARLFDLSCLGNLRSLPFGPTRIRPWMQRLRPAMVEARPHDALNGVALTARNSHQINPHLPRPITRQSCSRLS